MKKLLLFTAVTVMALSCTKDHNGTGRYYTSLSEFYRQNGMIPQSYTVNAATGGDFSTPAGTHVIIPPNAFVTPSGQPVSGEIRIRFGDIYKKSDMLLSDRPPMLVYGTPLKSGGEFFIQAMAGNIALELAPGKKIDVEQPSFDRDTLMGAFVAGEDTLPGNGWWPSVTDSVTVAATGYIYSMYNFQSPLENGSWCNSDNSYFFAAFPQTVFTVHSTDASYYQDVYLIFSGVNSMVHIYGNMAGDYTYNYAPEGLQCTVVALGVKDGKLYSSFTPVTIGQNMTVNFSMDETTGEAFIAQLEELND